MMSEIGRRTLLAWMVSLLVVLQPLPWNTVLAGRSGGGAEVRSIRDPLPGGGMGPEMIVIPAGRFMMGDQQGAGYNFERPVHQVVFGKAFAIGKFEVTFEDYDRFCAETGHPFAKDDGFGRGRRPAINVSWHDAVKYAGWLSAKTGQKYRLPTEAEWEYAARGSSKSTRFWGESLEDACGYANVADRELLKSYPDFKVHPCTDGHRFTAPVGLFLPNGYGLHDMLGNVWEWCQDDWHNDYSGAPQNGEAWLGIGTENQLRRGGSWFSVPKAVRSATRNGSFPEYKGNETGFRLIREL